MKPTLDEMKQVAKEAHLIRLFGSTGKSRITLDYVPARAAMIIPRLDEDEPLTAAPPAVIPLTFLLEDQMFGTTTFASITCQGHIIVPPFVWESWGHLARSPATNPA